MARFAVVGAENQSGLSRSSRLLAAALRAGGHDVLLRQFTDEPGDQRYDGVVLLERIVPRWLAAGTRTALVPNQEWFDDRDGLARIDAVWCKTRYAEGIFAACHPNVQYLGFTSDDRRDLTVARDWRSFLHVAGRSLQKGTGPVLEAWRRHPEWPPLTVIRHPETPVRVAAGNIRTLSAHVSDADLRRHENQHGIHLCPSEAEGFGHSLVQGMSCGAVVLTTDGPPMNELVTRERGVLVPAGRSGRQRLGVNWYVDADDLATAVRLLLAMPIARLRALGAAARHWYEANDAALRPRVAAVARALLSGAAPHS